MARRPDYDHEHDLLEDWGEVKRTAGIVLRYPRTIASVTTLVIAAVTLVTMSRGPVFRSSLTLQLDDENARNPVLEDLSIPTGTVEAEEAVATLGSSALLRKVVANPEGGGLAWPEHPEYAERMGLTTLVEPAHLGTVRGYVEELRGGKSADFRVFARMERVESGAPETLLVRFAGGLAELSVPEDVASTTWPAGVVVPVDFEPGRAFEVRGVRLHLGTMGTPDGRTYRIRWRTEDEAIAWVTSRLSVVDKPDEASTVLVSFDDVDPRRAAEIANALATNYLEHDAQRTQERAREIVDYVDDELAQRSAELARLDTDIARILERYPDAIDLQKGFLQLNDSRSLLDAQLVQVQTLRRSLEEMARQLEAGNRAMASRLGQRLDDPMTRRYLEYIATLKDEGLRVDRDTTSSYQSVLRAHQADARELLHQIEGRLRSIDLLIADLTAGDMSALARIGDETAQGGITTVDDLTLQYARSYVDASKELAALELEFAPGYHKLETKRKQMQGLLDKVLAHLRSRRKSVALEVQHSQDLYEQWSGLIETLPLNESVQIRAAEEELWQQVLAAIQARVTGLQQEEATLGVELADIELRIADLPEARRLLREPETQRESLEKVVGTLIEKKEMAAIAAAGALPTVEILHRARVPKKPLSPSLHLGLAIGLLLGTFLSVGSCLLHENFRGRLRSHTDYADLGGAPLLGTLEGSHGAASFHGDNQRTGDALRALRARLRAAERERGTLRSLAITSASAGEGKTSTIAGLAAAYALEGRDVLLIDANLRKPRIHEHLGLEGAPGLAEALDGRKHWMQCTAPTGLPGLDVLAAGNPYYAPADMLAGVAMERLLDEVAESYDIALLDLPCVDGLPDVTCVGPLLDGVLFLCSDQRGPTRRELQRTLETLTASDVPLLGLVRQARPTKLPHFTAPSRARAVA